MHTRHNLISAHRTTLLRARAGRQRPTLALCRPARPDARRARVPKRLAHLVDARRHTRHSRSRRHQKPCHATTPAAAASTSRALSAGSSASPFIAAASGRPSSAPRSSCSTCCLLPSSTAAPWLLPVRQRVLRVRVKLLDEDVVRDCVLGTVGRFAAASCWRPLPPGSSGAATRSTVASLGARRPVQRAQPGIDREPVGSGLDALLRDDAEWQVAVVLVLEGFGVLALPAPSSSSSSSSSLSSLSSLAAAAAPASSPRSSLPPTCFFSSCSILILLGAAASAE